MGEVGFLDELGEQDAAKEDLFEEGGNEDGGEDV